MAIKVAINGFGRIGRLIFRAGLRQEGIEFVAVNDIVGADNLAYLLQYDSTHGRLDKTVSHDKDGFSVCGKRTRCVSVRDPAELPWKELGVEYVVESTGLFTDYEHASKHLAAGARRVLISAPTKSPDRVPTFAYKVNHDRYDPKTDTVISNASCTTNCLAPVADVLNRAVGIEKGFMTTIHAYTGDQRMVDTLHADLRRARAAAMSMIPTSTGAARSVGLVLPELDGKLDGTAVRVPTANVSMIDLTFVAGRSTSVEEVNNAIVEAARGRLKGVLGTVDEPLVSVDFNHNPLSSIFDLSQTQVVGGDFVRVLSWYDNEWGFSNRMADTAVAMANAG